MDRQPEVKTLCVLGLGYVGLPTAAVFAVNGFQVIGVDPRRAIVDSVNAGDAPIEEIGLRTLVHAAVNSGNLRALQEPESADAFIIAVPTPLRKDRSADLSYVEQAAASIVPHLNPGNLVVLESTSPPGTTENLLSSVLSRSGLTPSVDLFIAYCPERVLPGHILSELVENDRVIGGIDPESGHRAALMYQRVVEGRVYVTSAIVAELVKLFENAYRDVNIAFANELARVCSKWAADPSEVVELANRHPRVNILKPGPGVGGHCIPIDPWFLVSSAPADSALMRAARGVNDSQPQWIAQRTIAALPELPDLKVAVWGAAYKGNVDDARETPAIAVIEALTAAGIQASVFDPHVKEFTYPLSDLGESLEQADCLLVLADHKEFELFEPGTAAKRMRTKLVFDARGILPRASWKAAGFRVVTI